MSFEDKNLITGIFLIDPVEEFITQEYHEVDVIRFVVEFKTKKDII